MRKRKLLFLFILLFLTFGFFSRVKLAWAQATGPLETLRENISSSDTNLWQWTYGQQSGGEVDESGLIPAIEHSLLGQLMGVPDETGVFHSGGAINQLARVIGTVFASPPASGVYYASTILQELGVAPAYAANGFGFSQLSPLLNIWKAFRNMVYALFAIAMLIIGLMIMFRMKISPQAVLTVENALPRVIGVLVLITFSYAIAGFMIDLMYVVIGLVILVAGQAGLVGNVLEAQKIYIDSGMGPLSKPLLGAWFRGIDDIAKIIYGGDLAVLGGLIGGAVGAGIGSLLVPGIGTLIGLGAGALGGGYIVGVLVALILSIVGLFLLFKLFINLVKIYINIILQIIFSPLFILPGIFPSSTGGFGNWLRGLAANLLVFPALTILVIIADSLINASVGTLWSPPFVGGSGLQHGMTAIIGFGFLLILPNVPDIIRNALGIKDSGIGSMIGAAFAPAKGAGTGLMQYGGSLADERYEKAKKMEPGAKWKERAPKAAADVLRVFGKIK